MNTHAPRPPATPGSPAAQGRARREHGIIVTCAVLAVIAIVAGITAVVLDQAVIGLVAAAAGVGAAGIAALVDVRRTRADDSLWEARSHIRRLRREIDERAAGDAEDRAIAGAHANDPRRADPLPVGTDTDDWEIDPVSGLIRERHLAVVLGQVIAAARRKVQPASVIYWELDAVEEAPVKEIDEALTALGAVAWRTLRESDAVFRLGDRAALGVLIDTSQPGALIVAERVRESLRSSAIGDALTVSAGIACYPTNALDAVELVSRASHALEAARAEGRATDHIVIADPDPTDDPT